MTQQSEPTTQLIDPEQLREHIHSLRQSYKTPHSDSMMSIIDKVERIATALHLVTDHMSREEPVRNHLRQHAMSLMSEMARGHVTGDNHSWYHIAIGHSEAAMGTLRLAHMSRLISETNALLIERELVRLHQLLVQEYNHSPHKTTYNPARDGYDTHLRLQSVFIRDDDEQSQHVSIEKDGKGIRVTHVPIDTDKSRERELPIRKQEAKNSIDVREAPYSRKQDILTFIRNNGRVTMRDIAERIPGVSEKTIQRALIDLMEGGDIKRIGDRRWAYYEPVIVVQS